MTKTKYFVIGGDSDGATHVYKLIGYKLKIVATFAKWWNAKRYCNALNA